MKTVKVAGLKHDVMIRGGVFDTSVREYTDREDDKHISGMVATPYGLVDAYCQETYDRGKWGRYLGFMLFAHDGEVYTNNWQDKGRVTVAATVRQAKRYAELVGRALELPVTGGADG